VEFYAALATIVDMKIQLNIANSQKSIKIEESIKLNDLIIALDKIFPKKEWKDFLLEKNTIIDNWECPIYLKDTPYAPQLPWVTCTENAEDTYGDYGGFTCELNKGTFNIEI
jgi:hypothetical protein